MEGPRSFFVGKDKADFGDQGGAPQVDFDPPLFKRGIRVGLPVGVGVAVEDIVGRRLVGASFPRAALDLLAADQLVGEFAGVEGGIVAIDES